MIPQVLLGIATAIHKNYPEARIYFNPIRQVQGNSFLVSLLSYGMEGEQNAIFRHHFDWDIAYVPKVVQTPPIGIEVTEDTRMTKGAEAIQELFYVLDGITVKGFYNITTKEEDNEEIISTFDRSISVVGDIYHYFFSMEFRTRRVEQWETIETWKIVTKMLEEINS